MLGLGKGHTNMGTSANAQDQEEDTPPQPMQRSVLILSPIKHARFTSLSTSRRSKEPPRSR